LTQVKPYGIEGKSKKEEVAEMFDNISGKYDFLNHTLSMGIDRGWRKKALRKIDFKKVSHLLDIATGTGDFALAAKKAGCAKVTGIDISNGMLEVGRNKVLKAGFEGTVSLTYGDSENMPFENNTFDAITVAFGVRNFENLEQGLKEMIRVLKPGGIAVVLEFSKPTAFPIKQLYGFYFNHVLPRLGKAVSGDQAAYNYLPESVNVFPEGNAFKQNMVEAGFHDCNIQRVTFGIATIYTGTKS
jgi:demethylmenaquinone methyltransferase/2-methoxy-6-polyprenyl-1,4-benzoquinol methylase